MFADALLHPHLACALVSEMRMSTHPDSALGHLEERCCQVQVAAHTAIAWGISRFPILMSMSRSTYATHKNVMGMGGLLAVFMSNMAQAESTYQWPHLESARGVPGIYCTRSAFRLPVIAVALCVPVLFRMDSRGISVVLMSSPDYGTVTTPPAVQIPNHGPKGVC